MTTSDLVILRLAIDGIEARVRKAYEETGAAKSIGSRQTLSETLDNARDNINNALQIVEALKATLKFGYLPNLPLITCFASNMSW